MGSRWLDRVGLTNQADLQAVLDAPSLGARRGRGHVHQAYDGRAQRREADGYAGNLRPVQARRRRLCDRPAAARVSLADAARQRRDRIRRRVGLERRARPAPAVRLSGFRLRPAENRLCPPHSRGTTNPPANPQSACPARCRATGHRPPRRIYGRRSSTSRFASDLPSSVRHYSLALPATMRVTRQARISTLRRGGTRAKLTRTLSGSLPLHPRRREFAGARLSRRRRRTDLFRARARARSSVAADGSATSTTSAPGDR